MTPDQLCPLSDDWLVGNVPRHWDGAWQRAGSAALLQACAVGRLSDLRGLRNPCCPSAYSPDLIPTLARFNKRIQPCFTPRPSFRRPSEACLALPFILASGNCLPALDLLSSNRARFGISNNKYGFKSLFKIICRAHNSKPFLALRPIQESV